jgi:xanthine dehydrogenase accessory factor
MQPTPLAPVGVVRTAEAAVAVQARLAPGTLGLVDLDPALAAALDGLDGFDWAWMITLLDRATDPRDPAAAADGLRPVPLLLTESGTRVGALACRHPDRPNRLGLSLVRLLGVDGTTVRFAGVDVADGTPVLDLKPWVAAFDLPEGSSRPAGVRCGWFDAVDTLPMTLGTPEALVVTSRDLAGHAAVTVRTVHLDGLGATDAGEIAIVDHSGVRAGSILGGVLDGVLVELTRHTAPSGPHAPGARLLELDVSGDEAVAAGLTCGGHASLVVQPIDQVPGRWWDAVASREPVALVTNLDAPHLGSVLVEPGRTDAPVSGPLLERALGLLAGGRSRSVLEDSPDGRMLVESHLPRPRLFVVGRAQLAADLVDLAGWLGWAGVRATDASEVAAATLGSRDALIVLDHGLRTTGPLLVDALRSRCGYVGALGSRTTQRKRRAHLRGLGITDEELTRLHGPAGLDLGPANRAEIALAICAEITAVRAGRAGGALRDGEGHIRT